MSRSIILTCIGLQALVFGACARPQLAVERVEYIRGNTDERDNDGNAIEYSLPRTRLVLEFEINQTRRCRGPLAEIGLERKFQYTHPGLSRLGEIEETTSFEIVSLALLVDSEPDPEARFRVSRTRDWRGRLEPLALDLTSLGLLVTEPAAGRLNDILDGNVEEGESGEANATSAATRGFLGCVPNAQRSVLAAKKRAGRLANSIDDLTDRRLLLIAGHVGTTQSFDSETLEIMLDELDREIALLGRDFVYEVEETVVERFELKDDWLEGGHETSIVDLDAGGDRCTAMEQCTGRHRYVLRVADRRSDLAVIACTVNCTGLVYRRPRIFRLSLVQQTDKPRRERVLLDELVPVAQRGDLVLLPDFMDSAVSLGSVTFHPDSGGLRSIRTHTRAGAEQRPPIP